MGVEPKVTSYFLNRYGTDRFTLGLMANLKSNHSTPRTPREIVFSFGGQPNGLIDPFKVSVYDPTRKNWGDSETALGFKFDENMGVVLVGSNVFFCGDCGTDNEGPTSKLIRLDLQSMQFENLSKMMNRREWFCLTNVDDSIYAIGGEYMDISLN